MTPLPPGWRYGHCDWCGRRCLRPKGSSWYPCWRASCHPATEVRLFVPATEEQP